MPRIILKGGKTIEVSPEQFWRFAKLYMVTPVGVDKPILKKDGKVYYVSDLADAEEIKKLKQKALDI